MFMLKFCGFAKTYIYIKYSNTNNKYTNVIKMVNQITTNYIRIHFATWKITLSQYFNKIHILIKIADIPFADKYQWKFFLQSHYVFSMLFVINF